ncbi:MAG: UDP-2,3-diacylglucosamine diphosphatase [Gammaproteobacteria bacterium]|nr:UDP-2,3-diacylglucosamine diphosphatase [Gammaproteobacteria bacterium]
MDYTILKTDKPILFISDLHLSPQRPEMVQIFLEFCEKEAREASAVYILGDMFDIWVGDDDLSDLHQTILMALKKLTEGRVSVFVMHGNHDFLLGSRFESMTGCRLIPDPWVISERGEPVVLMHGDSLCSFDKEYQQFRSKIRKPWVNKLLSFLPLFFRRFLARYLRSVSQGRSTVKADLLLDVSLDAVQNVLLHHKARCLIHGHTHRPRIHEVQVKERLGQRIVLGDWYTRDNIWIYEMRGRGLLQVRS